jgi:hypothetical protein
LRNFKKIRILIEEELEIEDSIHFINARCLLREIESMLENVNVSFRKFRALNHHMNLQFWEQKQKKDSNLYGKAIYFFRYGKSSSFAPFYIKTSDDIKILKTFFDEVWKKAKKLDI